MEKEKQQADIIVVYGMVVSSNSIEPKAVVIKAGQILDTPENADAYEADRIVDANGKFVLPGIIDAHFHPVYADRIDTLSKAAATGGITTLIPYVGAVAAWGQGGDLVDAVKSFIEEGESSSILDFGLHCTFTQNDIAESERSIPALIEMGIVSFKGFTAYKKRGTLAKMSPPLRRPADVAALWRAIQEGDIDVIGSDAAGHTVAANEPLDDDVFSAPHGIPGLDTMFTVTYSEGVNKGRITLPHLVKMTSENPARIVGLFPKKGTLAIGADADVVIFDPALAHRIPPKNAHTNVDYSLYEGRHCLGAPVMVMQRGRVVLENGEIQADHGQGHFLAGKFDAV